ncbi:hypothetical protein T11_4595 [Trichinella zimbabwensis]|uniref:Uncharacterized protein n=1 Tax=Trichinella zimbabwensis TaxID=268475 RepID=A0A0V1G9J1_9BILA|nr:hypothetical protein T11_4595 [Trichinella zimbabwensis]
MDIITFSPEFMQICYIIQTFLLHTTISGSDAHNHFFA